MIDIFATTNYSIVMNYTKPFYIRGVKVSVHNGTLVKVYHAGSDVNDEQKELIDNVVQYLMDELFVRDNKCRVEINCDE